MNSQQAHIRVLFNLAADEFREREAVSLDTLVALQMEGVFLDEVTRSLDELLS